MGFVPTMGALHEGHAALVRRARAENDVVVTSIFVNPTQFNNKSDLAHYPRTPEADARLLESSGCDILFQPTPEEMYPHGLDEPAPAPDLGRLAAVMEGTHRPGHFAGVTLIVKKLFEAVGECNTYFGQKDFQQLAIVRRMVQLLSMPVNVIGCPMSSGKPTGWRCRRATGGTTAEERNVAPLISHALFNTQPLWPALPPEALKAAIAETIAQEPLMRLEYVEIADTETLEAVAPGQQKNAVVCIAVHLGTGGFSRVVDNVILA